MALLFRNRTYFPHSVNSCLAVGEMGSGLLKSFLERDKSRQREYGLVDANGEKKREIKPGLDVPAFLEYNLKIQSFQRHYNYATRVKLCLSGCIV